MARAVLIACLPWFLTLLASAAALWVLARMSRVRVEWRRLLHLHADQTGSAQTLSFVMTLPVFIWVLLFIVQVSQLMIGQVVVHYAAYAAARAASVWIAADCSGENTLETANRMAGGYSYGSATTDTTTGATGATYVIAASGVKYEKVRLAAVLGCMPISPSRSFGANLSSSEATTASYLITAYNAMTQSSTGVASTAVTNRIRNKLAFADANTAIQVAFFHSDAEVPPNVGQASPADNLIGCMGSDCYLNGGTAPCFYSNEVGWRDAITVTVTHNLAMLPGAGRLLSAFSSSGAKGSSGVYSDTYVYQLSAAATVGNEGERPVVSYVY